MNPITFLVALFLVGVSSQEFKAGERVWGCVWASFAVFILIHGVK